MQRTLLIATSMAVLGIGYVSIAPHGWPGQRPVDYSTQIKPLLNKHCIACHGGVKKAGGFSVLFEEEALAKTKSGKPAIIPGDAAHSDFIKRLTHADPDERMPYKAPALSTDEIDLLTRWIDEGASWGKHWAYNKPQAPTVPGRGMLAGIWPFGERWERRDLDYFVSDRHEREGLTPRPQADPATLLRRVALDLTGLPPTQAQYDRYTANPTPATYEKLVDELLASPAYGERWAALWLDLARYADSKGYEKDHRRWNQWHYRDWLIRAFNQDMPYDRFTALQLAGDLLPGPNGGPPTDEQYIATMFSRNTPTNDEGGTDDEEFRTSAVLDRVNTTMEIWQGTTFGCVQCHSHPYDPFRHEDYYKLAAFFNNTQDSDLRNEAPNLHRWREPEQQKVNGLADWLSRNVSVAAGQSMVQFMRFQEPRFYYHDFQPIRNAAQSSVVDMVTMTPGAVVKLPGVVLTGQRELILSYTTIKRGVSLEIRRDSETGPLLAQTPLDTTGWFKFALKALPIPATTGRHDLVFILKNAVGAGPVTKGDGLGMTNNDVGLEWVLPYAGLPGQGKPGYAAQQQVFYELLTAPHDALPVVVERPRDYARPSHVFVRGNWLVKGPVVQPDVPAALGTLTNKSASLLRNRLGLAQWLTSPDNPLTARTAVNRLWEQLFGIGLVETLEDFGTQGFAPSHPELLDHLAVLYRDEFGYSQKKLLRYIVTSATYQQDSRSTETDRQRDPYNRLLARGPRYRLTAEQVRDQALAISGVLNAKAFGPPVMPAQPDGVWQTPFDYDHWATDTNGNQYRRAIYIFQKRSAPYPSLITFDGSNRQVCLSRRIRTNTPLQALVTLNDPVYLDISRHLARRMQRVGGADPARQVGAGYQLATGHAAPTQTLTYLMRLYQDALREYRAKPNDAKRYVQDPNARPEFAALTTVANTLLNLDELVVKQ